MSGPSPSGSSSFVGIDVGRSKTVIIRQNGDLVLTETGGIVRASLLAFAGRARYVGEEAAQAQSGSASCVVVGGDVTAVSSSLARFVKAGLLQLDERGGVMATVQYCDDTITIPLVALLGMFIARQDARIREVTGDNKVRLAFVMPTDCSPALRAAVRAACHIARIEPGRVHLVDRVDALVSAYRRKQQVASSSSASSSSSSGDEGRLVVLCDVGCEQSTLILLRESSSSIKALSHAQLPLGAAHFDSALFDHFSPSAGSPAPDSKRGGRLLGACERLRKLLSQLPSSSVVCENMNDSGADVNLSLSRADLASIAEPLLAALRAAVAAVLLSAGPGAFVEVVEMLGGGARMPCVQALVAAACPGAVLGWRFDDGSQALGAALFASASSSSSSSTSSSSASGSASTASGGEGEGLGAPQDEIELLAQQEDEWQGRDREWCELLQCRNAIETAILSLRSARSQHPGLAHLLPQELEAALDGFEDWLWSHPDASLAETTAQGAAMESELSRLAGPFHQALEQERRKGGGAGKGDTKAGEEEAVAAGEKAGSSPNPPDRLRLTLKNLAEADDLLRGDVVTELQLRAALARFNKALSHCLSLPGTLPSSSSSSSSAAAVGSKRPAPPSPAPSADQQAASLLERIHLGLATCHSKLKNIDLAIAACSAALSAAPSSVAALSTRSELFVAKKDWERASEDAAAAVAAIKRRGGSGDELAAAVLWAGKLSSRAREEEKAKKSAKSSCSVM